MCLFAENITISQILHDNILELIGNKCKGVHNSMKLKTLNSNNIVIRVIRHCGITFMVVVLFAPLSHISCYISRCLYRWVSGVVEISDNAKS
jgi:hypothetical protein